MHACAADRVRGDVDRAQFDRAARRECETGAPWSDGFDIACHRNRLARRVERATGQTVATDESCGTAGEGERGAGIGCLAKIRGPGEARGGLGPTVERASLKIGSQKNFRERSARIQQGQGGQNGDGAVIHWISHGFQRRNRTEFHRWDDGMSWGWMMGKARQTKGSWWSTAAREMLTDFPENPRFREKPAESRDHRASVAFSKRPDLTGFEGVW